MTPSSSGIPHLQQPRDLSKEHPNAFGLGVGAGFRPAFGAYWYYQGMTLGYRVLYAYFPKNGAVIVVGLNSQPDDKQNHNGAHSGIAKRLADGMHRRQQREHEHRWKEPGGTRAPSFAHRDRWPAMR